MTHRLSIHLFCTALLIHCASALVPIELRCNGKTDPLDASPSPLLSWRLDSTDRSVAATAWQILVATSPKGLEADQGDLWDSGRVKAHRSPHVRYGGSPLPAGQRCYWKVRIWSAKGAATRWSEPGVWEIAPQSPADWHGARWISDGKPLPSSDADFYKPDPAPLMRHEFELSKPVLRARLHVTGLGWCVPSLNGSRVGDHVLDPPWTAYAKRVFFSSYDVTQQLENGPNCLGLSLGNGWFNPLPLRMWGRRNIRDTLTTGRPRGIACLLVDHPDGSQTKITTGPDWRFSEGPLQSNSVYLGEVHDARLENDGWNKPGHDASAWRPVKVVDAPLETLEALAMPPVRAGETIAAVAITPPAPGVHIVDFGQNFTGVPDMLLRATAGTRITFRFGELLNKDGSLNPMTSVCGQIKGMRKGPNNTEVPIGGPGAPPIAWQQDIYIAKGGGAERYRPEHTYHAFRFMEITGLEHPPQSSDFNGIPLATDFESVGSFSCSNEGLNQIQQMCRRTFLANVVSVQSDCPHRERFGYGGDIVASSEAFLMNFDMSAFYAKTVRDWADGALPDGNLTDTAPFVGIQYCGVGWAMIHPLLIEQLYQHYGNRDLIEEQLPVAIRWLELEASARNNGLVTKGLGDHEALSKAGGPVVTTPMFIDSARRVARLAKVIGLDGDAARFEAMAETSAAAWEKEFLDPNSGRVGKGSQTELSLALGFGSAPKASRSAIFDRLVGELDGPNGPALTTGIFGTRFLLEELSSHGRSDLAFGLASRKTFPSWGWMLENDATTLWEHWAGSDGTFSHNHPMFGSISAWFFRWLGGIQAADDAVGFDRVVISPQVVDGLEWVKSSHRSIHGLIESNWSTTPEERSFEVVIPPNTTAIVNLAVEPEERVLEGDSPAEEGADLKILPSGPGNHRMQIGSGRYQFRVRKQPQKSDDE